MILDFFKTVVNLKNISRQGWIDKLSLEHPESVADHSYSMAIMGMVISDLENYDSEKMSESEKDQLIDAQKQVIGILFEVIKRLQTNTRTIIIKKEIK